MKGRKRAIYSIKKELIKKSQEAALAAVQIFNNPLITFKSESFIVLMNVAWTYLMHAYYREKKIEYRHFKKEGKNRKFFKTRHKAFKYWELETCLKNVKSPIDTNTANNLYYLIGIRHEIEHKMTNKIDNFLIKHFYACCLNYNKYIKKLFGQDYAIEKHLSFSLQFSTISKKQKEQLEEHQELLPNIKGFIKTFESDLSEDELLHTNYACRIFFEQKIANKKEQANTTVEFISSKSSFAKNANKEYAAIKETEKPKFLPNEIVKKMKNKGYTKFSMYTHTQLWKSKDAKNPLKGYGTSVSGHWYWYENWLKIVEEDCKKQL